MDEHPQHVRKFLDRLYGVERRRYECRARTPEDFAAWQVAARHEFNELLKLPLIAEQSKGHTPEVSTSPDKEDLGDCFRQQGWIETEPDVPIQFWMLTPKSNGPFPLAVTPHGHEDGDTYAGIGHDGQTRERIEKEDRDVAVQAASRGFLTIAPATRGIGQNPKSFRVADITNRHDGRDCRCHNWQVLMAGRTMLGERVWDLMRILDWALARPEVNSNVVLMLGNSGGGMATLHTAAADERVTIAVPCCAYSNYLSPLGTLRHCPCNAIPGLMTFGEYWDVAGLVAPRRMLTVNGDTDALHPVEEVNHAVSRLKEIYKAAGAANCYEHRFGHGGHRFYSDLMWP
ncbi:alpha/beta hydrolase family protein, partial [Verrucomicrobiota bacterium]